MHNFSRADGGEVSVPLIGKDRAFGVGALNAGGDGRRPAVGRLDSVAGEIVPGEYGASNRTYENGTVDYPELFQHFANELMYRPVSASRAVVGLFFCQSRRFTIFHHTPSISF
ncbi:hypothetical protein SDC9_209231 [bioreactor metagenome]|uniref:Uncharacterized protein n=1 Tax=bioreactor metagenome TaxID=1076179 RepID=A0A645JMD7_9ZZZZ